MVTNFVGNVKDLFKDPNHCEGQKEEVQLCDMSPSVLADSVAVKDQKEEINLLHNLEKMVNCEGLAALASEEARKLFDANRKLAKADRTNARRSAKCSVSDESVVAQVSNNNVQFLSGGGLVAGGDERNFDFEIYFKDEINKTSTPVKVKSNRMAQAKIVRRKALRKEAKKALQSPSCNLDETFGNQRRLRPRPTIVDDSVVFSCS